MACTRVCITSADMITHMSVHMHARAIRTTNRNKQCCRSLTHQSLTSHHQVREDLDNELLPLTPPQQGLEVLAILHQQGLSVTSQY